jgi:hypothetical protein
MLTGEALRQMIEATVHECAAPFIVTKITVVEDEDWEGDPAIHIEAWYALNQQPFRPRLQMTTQRVLNERLEAAGDRRFPYFRPRLDKAQKLASAA